MSMEMPLRDQACVGRQLDFHRSPARNRICVAGNRAGKTEGGAREAGFTSTGFHPYREVTTPNIGWVVTLDREIGISVVRPKILRYLPTDMVKRVTTDDVPMIELHNGSVIKFKSAESKWSKFQSAAVDWVWYDEEIPEKIFRECRIRLIDRRGCWWMTLTPVNGITWIYHELIKPSIDGDIPLSRLELFNWSSLDNTALSREEFDEVFAGMSEDERRIRMAGEWVNRTGLILSEFDERVHMVDPIPIPEWWPVLGGLDQGTGHPFGAFLTTVDEEGGLLCWSTYRQSRRLISDHCIAIVQRFQKTMPWRVNQEVYDQVFDERGHRKAPPRQHLLRDVRWAIDPSAAQTKLELIPYGIVAENAIRDWDAGIERFNQLLRDRKEGRPGIRFVRGQCNEFVMEARTWSWKSAVEDGQKPTPNKVGDDVCDAGRYTVMMRPAGATRPARPAFPPGSFGYEDKLLEQAERLGRIPGNESVSPEECYRHAMRVGKGF